MKIRTEVEKTGDYPWDCILGLRIGSCHAGFDSQPGVEYEVLEFFLELDLFVRKIALVFTVRKRKREKAVRG